MKNDNDNHFTETKQLKDLNSILKNTSVSTVLDNMYYPEKCIICKGYFPDTIPEEEVEYSLVSIDCDLYNPILEGLRYFYPRLSKGGYIMLHEYNFSFLSGSKQAF